MCCCQKYLTSQKIGLTAVSPSYGLDKKPKRILENKISPSMKMHENYPES